MATAFQNLQDKARQDVAEQDVARTMRFLESLRADGFQIDGRHMAQAQRLTLAARASGKNGYAARRLKYLLAPVVANSAAQQSDFYRRYDRWAGPVVTGRIMASPADPPEAVDAAKTDRRWLIGITALLLAIIAGTGFAIWQWYQPVDTAVVDLAKQADPDPTVDAVLDLKTIPADTIIIREDLVSPSYRWILLSLLASPFLAFGSWLVRRYQQRLMWLESGRSKEGVDIGRVKLPRSILEALYASQGFRASAQNLRRHRTVPTRQLDVVATVEGTIRQGGIFNPTWRERPHTPEYLFMIEQESAHDHLARLFDLAVERLRSEGVTIEVFYYHRDPRFLMRDDTARTPVNLTEIAARAGEHRLVVLGTADGMFHPLSGDVEEWVDRFDPWSTRVVMSSRPISQWTNAELTLLEEGFSLATARPTGFANLGEKVSLGDEEESELLEGRLIRRPAQRAWRPGGSETVPEMQVLVTRIRKLKELADERLAGAEPQPDRDPRPVLAMIDEALGQARPALDRVREALERLGELMRRPELAWLRASRLLELLRRRLDEDERVVEIGRANEDDRASEVEPTKRKPSGLAEQIRRSPPPGFESSVEPEDRVNSVPLVILCYSVHDQDPSDRPFHELREALERDLRASIGVSVHVVEATDATEPARALMTVIETSPDATRAFVLPLLSRTFFASAYCRNFLQESIDYEEDGEPSDIAVLPVRYRNDFDPNDHSDPLLQMIASRQFIDLANPARVDPAEFEEAVETLARVIRVRAGLVSFENDDNVIYREQALRSNSFLPSMSGTIFRDVEEPWCPDMVVIPAGIFMMGSPSNEKGRRDNEGPQHEVTIAKPFALGRYPVTFEEFDHFCQVTGRKLRDDEGWGRGLRPVINVSFEDAEAYADWLSKLTEYAYRLPSEAEWEYACRAGTVTRYSFGDDIRSDQANFGSNDGKTLGVGQYPANPFGLFDMHGNVWEWCADLLHENYEGAPSDGSPWIAGKDSDRVMRGGSWGNGPEDLRSAFRGRIRPVIRNGSVGFRLARTLTP